MTKTTYLEKHFQGDFTRYLKTNSISISSFGYELKRTTGGTVAFSKFEDQQLPALLNSKSDVGVHHKISDMSINLKPMDGFVLKNCDQAYVGIVFYANDKAKRCFHFIDIFYVMQIKNKGAKSITVADCLRWGFELKL